MVEISDPANYEMLIRWATRPLARQSARAWIDMQARLAAEHPSDHTFLVAEFAL